MRVRIILAAAFFPLGMLVVSASGPNFACGQEPPKIHIDKGACPFECCTYREWVARTDATLVDRPNGKRVVGRIKKGDKVLALTGEVHSVPLRAVANRDYSDAGVKAGDTIYILHYLGEGYWKIWHDGKLVEIEDFPGKGPKPKFAWWVKLKTSSEVIGWTIERNNFENQDACG
jgi:hypothetical protein